MGDLEKEMKRNGFVDYLDKNAKRASFLMERSSKSVYTESPFSSSFSQFGFVGALFNDFINVSNALRWGVVLHYTF